MKKKLLPAILFGFLVASTSFPVFAAEVVAENPPLSSPSFSDGFNISDYLHVNDDTMDDTDQDPEEQPDAGDLLDDGEQSDGEELPGEEQTSGEEELPGDETNPGEDNPSADQPVTDETPSDSLAADVAEIRSSLGILIENSQPFFTDEVEKQTFFDNFAALRKDMDLLIYAVIPISAAIFAIWKFCQWFYRTFIHSALE